MFNFPPSHRIKRLASGALGKQPGTPLFCSFSLSFLNLRTRMNLARALARQTVMDREIFVSYTMHSMDMDY